MKTKGLFSKAHRHAALALAIIAALLAATSVLASDGGLDPTFDYDGKVVTAIRDEDGINAVAIQPDGKIVSAGWSITSGDEDFSLARYSANGSLDASFDSDGKVVTDIQGKLNEGYSVALQTDGKIVVAGLTWTGVVGTGDFTLVRYNSNGSPDPTFDGDGIVVTNFGANDLGYAVAIQADGKIVVAGASDNGGEYNFALARYNTNGSLDGSFDGDGKVITDIQGTDIAYAILIQPDGRIVVAGDSLTTNGTLDFALARYNINGSLDGSFDGDGKVVTDIQGKDNTAYSIARQSDGRIVAAGTTGYSDFTLVRYNSNGSRDATFDGDGIVVTNIGATDLCSAIAIQTDGKIIAAGSSNNWGEFNFALARYYPNGALDPGFDADGKVVTSIGGIDWGRAIALQADGKIVVAGESDGRYALARYYAAEPVTWISSFTSAGAQDGWILESSEASNVGGSLNPTSATIVVGDDAADRQYRAILSFNTAALPDRAVITQVILRIRGAGIAGTNPFTTHGNILVDVRKGAFSNNVALQLTDFQATASKPAVMAITNNPVSGWYSRAMSAANFIYINKTGLTQFRLRFTKDDNDDMAADFMKFYSGNADPTYRPRLIVRYYIP